MIRIVPKLFLIAILFSFSTALYGQVVQGVEAKIVEDNLVVTYRVGGINGSQLFNVELLSNQDNFQKPLKGDNLGGKIGERISLDASNDIVIKNPLDVIQGVTNVSFKVRVKMVFNPVSVTSHRAPFKQKMKKDMTITWSGGLNNESVNFDLYRNDEMVKDNMYTTSNTGTAEFKFPKVTKGENYQVKMEMASLPNPVELPIMRVKPKKSAVGRIFTWGVIIGGYMVIANANDLPPFQKVESDLPDAPNVPTN